MCASLRPSLAFEIFGKAILHLAAELYARRFLVRVLRQLKEKPGL
jgi:hypothetical protein